MAKKRGNPNWGRTPDKPQPVVPTKFDEMLREYGIDPGREDVLLRSTRVRDWVRKHAHSCYIPEPLLTALGFDSRWTED